MISPVPIAMALAVGAISGGLVAKLYYDERDASRIAADVVASIEARDAADQQRQETSNAWAKNLETIIADKGAYERCVAAGRCGAVVRVLHSACETGAVSAAGGVDEASAGPVPPAAGPSEASAETAVGGLIEDCKIAVGVANALQADIERQPLWVK